MPTIRTAAGKGAELTPTEADSDMKRTPVDKSSNYNLDATHNREVHELTGTVATVTLPTVSGSFSETDDWRITLINTLDTSVTVARNSQTIDDAASNFTLLPYGRVTIWMNSTFDGFWTDKRYVTGSFTGKITTTYLTVEQTGTCYYSIVGNSVTLYISAMTGTSVGTSMIMTDLPAILTPARTQACVARVKNTTWDAGTALISGTQIQFYPVQDIDTGFTPGVNAGINTQTLAFLLN